MLIRALGIIFWLLPFLGENNVALLHFLGSLLLTEKRYKLILVFQGVLLATELLL